MKKLLTLLLCALLTVSALPLTGLAAKSSDSERAISGSYVEGEAIVCLKTDTARSRRSLPGLLSDSELLMSLSSDTDTSDRTVAVKTKSEKSAKGHASDSSSLSLVHITDKSMSTAQLIEELESYPQVIFAEPNYITENYSMSAADPDLTQWQWGYQNQSDGDNPFENETDFNIGIPGWNSPGQGGGHNVVIAILDTGVDLNHPDLKDKLWTRPANSSLPGGSHGINLTGEGPADDVSDSNGHGTHCAGIAAAAWNNAGVSGVSEQAEIMAIETNNEIVSKIRGFNYVAQALREGINVRAVNLSWGGTGISKAVELAITEAGKAGAITLIASGNSGYDNDISDSMASGFLNNPYIVVVNAAAPGKTASYYTEYGKMTTDVFAPGTQILSTVPLDQSVYYPETDDQPVWYEDFESDAPSLVLTEDPSDTQGTSDLISLSEEKVYEGNQSLQIKKNTTETIRLYSQPIDLSSKADSVSGDKSISFKLSAQGQNGANVRLYVKTTDQQNPWEPVNISPDSTLDGSWDTCTAVLPQNTDYKNFRLMFDLAMFSLVFSDHDAAMNAGPATGSVYLDAIGIGDSQKAIPYAYMNGTSMAAPAAAGAAAILADIYNESGAKLAARVTGTVTKYDTFSDKCVSGGMIDLGRKEPYPVLNKATDQGDSIVVDGYFFDSVSSAKIGGMDAEILDNSQNIVSDTQDGEILILKKPAGFSGGMTEISVTTAAGEGHQSFDLGKTTQTTYFEEELPLPDDPDLAQITTFSLAGYHNQIFCLPNDLNEQPVHKIWAYSISDKTWKTINLPEELFGLTACTWNGTLAIAGYTQNSFGYLNEQLYFYDESNNETFTKAEIDLPPKTSLINHNGTLMCIGGVRLNETAGAYEDISDIQIIDPDTKKTAKAGEMLSPRTNPAVSTCNGSLLVSDIYGVELIQKNNHTGLYTGKELTVEHLAEGQTMVAFSNAGLKSSFALTGKKSGGTPAFDTYLVNPKTGETTVYEKLLDNGTTSFSAAAAYQDKLYVLACSYTNPERYIFRATAMETKNPQPGDLADDSSKPENPDEEQKPGGDDPKPDGDGGQTSDDDSQKPEPGNNKPNPNDRQEPNQSSKDHQNIDKVNSTPKTADYNYPAAAAFSILAVAMLAAAAGIRRLLKTT